MSREESIWQTELKDLIWLELQAYHADRTPIEEDEYLCSARESVEPLLQNIMNYRFKRLVIKTSLQVACDWPKKRRFFLTNHKLFLILYWQKSKVLSRNLILGIQKNIVHKTATVASKTTVLAVILFTVVHVWKLKMTL